MRYKILPPGNRGTFWYLRGSHRGQRFEVSTGTTDRQCAEVFAADYVAAFLRDSLPGPGEGPVTFKQATDAYIAFRDPRRDDLAALAKLKAELGARDVAAICHVDLVEAANSLLPGRANATQNRGVIGPAAAVL